MTNSRPTVHRYKPPQRNAHGKFGMCICMLFYQTRSSSTVCITKHKPGASGCCQHITNQATNRGATNHWSGVLSSFIVCLELSNSSLRLKHMSKQVCPSLLWVYHLPSPPFNDFFFLLFSYCQKQSFYLAEASQED